MAKDAPLYYEEWARHSQQLYCDILNKYSGYNSQKRFCMKVYAANYSQIDDVSELNKLWESLKNNT